MYKETPLRPRLLFIWKSRGNCPDFSEEMRDQECKRIALQDHPDKIIFCPDGAVQFSGKGLRQRAA